MFCGVVVVFVISSIFVIFFVLCVRQHRRFVVDRLVSVVFVCMCIIFVVGSVVIYHCCCNRCVHTHLTFGSVVKRE